VILIEEYEGNGLTKKIVTNIVKKENAVMGRSI